MRQSHSKELALEALPLLERIDRLTESENIVVFSHANPPRWQVEEGHFSLDQIKAVLGCSMLEPFILNRVCEVWVDADAALVKPPAPVNEIATATVSAIWQEEQPHRALSQPLRGNVLIRLRSESE